MDKKKAQGTHNGYMDIQYFGEKIFFPIDD